MLKHTPGPWKIGDKHKHNANLVTAKNHDSVAAVYGINLHSSVDEVKDRANCQDGLANARLIAKAPEMYEVIRSLLGASKTDYEIVQRARVLLKELDDG